MTKPHLQKIEDLRFHIENVYKNCLRLGQRLIEAGEVVLGHQLIANGQIHDNSKFRGIEWDCLVSSEATPEMLKLAVHQHNTTNPHHPEYWGSIHKMPRLYIAEMCCDWKARSSEFGSSLMAWVDGEAMTRFGYCKSDDVYPTIMYFVDMMCEKPFKKLEAE